MAHFSHLHNSNRLYLLYLVSLLLGSCQLHEYGAKNHGSKLIYWANPFVRNVKRCNAMAAYGGGQRRTHKRIKGYVPEGGMRSLGPLPPTPIQPEPVASTVQMIDGIPMFASAQPSTPSVHIDKNIPPPNPNLTPSIVKNYRTNGTKPKVILEPVTFESGKADFDISHAVQFQQAIEYGLSGYHVLITGHTDDVGTAESNLKLSMRRIEEIRRMLVHIGLDDNHVSIMPYGETEPLVPNTSEANRRKNRRVQFLIF